MSRPVFVLYRPWAPSVRAQSVQVIHAAHALAAHRDVTLCVRPTRATTSAAVLAHMGLAPAAGLHLRVLPMGGSAASLAFRAAFLRWRRRHPRGVGLSRTHRYARWATASGCPVVVEAHGVHDDVRSERGVLQRAHGLITNSPGTLRLLRRRHRVLPPKRVVPNATRGAGPPLVGRGRGFAYVGSVRDDKGLAVLAELSRRVDEPVVVMTPEPSAAHALGGRLVVRPAVAPHRVPAELAAFRALILPLASGRFGDHETCPLKLYDYLASGRPVVVADTSAMRALVPSWVPRFSPGDVEALVAALDEATGEAATARFAGRPLLRTWAQRAAEVDEALQRWVP